MEQGLYGIKYINDLGLRRHIYPDIKCVMIYYYCYLVNKKIDTLIKLIRTYGFDYRSPTDLGSLEKTRHSPIIGGRQSGRNK